MLKVLSVVLLLIVSNCLLAQDKLPVDRPIINWCLENDSIVTVQAIVIKEQAKVIDSLQYDKKQLSTVIVNQRKEVVNDSLRIQGKNEEIAIKDKESAELKKANKKSGHQNTFLKVLVVVLSIVAIAK